MIRELENLEMLLDNLKNSGSEEDYDAVMFELQDLENYVSSLIKYDTKIDVGIEEDYNTD